MTLIANILVGAVAALHGYILVLEMFLWTTPTGMRAFNMTAQKAQETAVLAANQGLYNGFLAAGLVYGLVAANATVGFHFKVFFLLCVMAAGLYGGYSVSSRIIMIQTVPAAIALFFVWLANR